MNDTDHKKCIELLKQRTALQRQAIWLTEQAAKLADQIVRIELGYPVPSSNP